jgi:hypothetical protein
MQQLRHDDLDRFARFLRRAIAQGLRQEDLNAVRAAADELLMRERWENRNRGQGRGGRRGDDDWRRN